MSLVVGTRVQQLLDHNGDSYATAGERTKVNRETLRRICLGYSSPKLRKYIRQIAEAYGVDEASLWEGESAKGEFEWMVRQASPGQRLEWVLMTPARRVKLTLDFLHFRYPNLVSVGLLATAISMAEPDLLCLLERWETHQPERAVALELAEAIHRLSGISRSWFESGGLAEAWLPSERLSRLAGMAQATWPEAVQSFRLLLKVATSN